MPTVEIIRDGRSSEKVSRDCLYDRVPLEGAVPDPTGVEIEFTGDDLVFRADLTPDGVFEVLSGDLRYPSNSRITASVLALYHDPEKGWLMPMGLAGRYGISENTGIKGNSLHLDRRQYAVGDLPPCAVIIQNDGPSEGATKFSLFIRQDYAGAIELSARSTASARITLPLRMSEESVGLTAAEDAETVSLPVNWDSFSNTPHIQPSRYGEDPYYDGPPPNILNTVFEPAEIPVQADQPVVTAENPAEAIVATQPGQEVQKNRGPGRPPGSKNRKPAEATDPLQPVSVISEKRKPGRPPKPRLPGETEKPIVKRKQGRPRGSKNKPKVVTPGQQEPVSVIHKKIRPVDGGLVGIVNAPGTGGRSEKPGRRRRRKKIAPKTTPAVNPVVVTRRSSSQTVPPEADIEWLLYEAPWKPEDYPSTWQPQDSPHSREIPLHRPDDAPTLQLASGSDQIPKVTRNRKRKSRLAHGTAESDTADKSGYWVRNLNSLLALPSPDENQTEADRIIRNTSCDVIILTTYAAVRPLAYMTGISFQSKKSRPWTISLFRDSHQEPGHYAGTVDLLEEQPDDGQKPRNCQGKFEIYPAGNGYCLRLKTNMEKDMLLLLQALPSALRSVAASEAFGNS